MAKQNSILLSLVISARNLVYTARYYHFDVITKRILGRAAQSVQSFEGKASFDDEKSQENLCIFVYFEPDRKVSKSNQRILNALRRNEVSTYVVANHKLSQEQIQFFDSLSIGYFERNNVGFDFGAYKDAIKWIKDQEIEFSRLILLNDSVFYIEHGLDDFVKGLLAQTTPTKGKDVIAAYENWGEGYHVQSFALSLSADIVRGQNFDNFWRNYQPISNRVYAIEKGEKKLSRAVLKDSYSSTVLFSVGELNRQIENDDKFSFQSKHIPIPFRPDFESVSRKNKSKLKQRVIDAVSQTSPIHAGAYYFPKYLNSPIFKKDLVFRQRFHFWEIQDWGSELMTEEELFEFSQILRKKADWKGLSRSDLRKYKIGVK